MSSMKILLCWLLIAGGAFAVEIPVETNVVAIVGDTSATNDVKVAEAVEAMTVVEGEEAAEAAEIAEMARKAEKKEARKTPEDVDPWEAFVPPADSEFDWIQLISGEWLKGDFKVLYDYTLEFDSDELDLLEFDFEDVKQLRTRGMKTVFLEGEGGPRDTSTLRGVLEIKDDRVVLRRTEHEVVIPRDRVISIAGGRQQERDYWSGMLSLGINARGGNTDTTDITAIANLKRRTAATRFNADYLSNYSYTGTGDTDTETANNQRLSGYYDRFLTSKFYWQVLFGEYYRDPFSNIDRQYSVSMGAGYDLMHTSRTEWGFNIGAGYQDQQFVSVEEGKDDSSNSPFFTAGTLFDHEISGSIDYLFDYSLRVLHEDNGQDTHHMLTTLSFDLVKDLDLDISLIWDRVEKPQPLADGSVPKQDDYQSIISLAYDF
jgi:hypothetical protein